MLVLTWTIWIQMINRMMQKALTIIIFIVHLIGKKREIWLKLLSKVSYAKMGPKIDQRRLKLLLIIHFKISMAVVDTMMMSLRLLSSILNRENKADTILIPARWINSWWLRWANLLRVLILITQWKKYKQDRWAFLIWSIWILKLMVLHWLKKHFIKNIRGIKIMISNKEERTKLMRWPIILLWNYLWPTERLLAVVSSMWSRYLMMMMKMIIKLGHMNTIFEYKFQ